jgi:hypothetical protein
MLYCHIIGRRYLIPFKVQEAGSLLLNVMFVRWIVTGSQNESFSSLADIPSHQAGFVGSERVSRADWYQ